MLKALKHKIRNRFASLTSFVPNFKGKGRLTMLIDSTLTDYKDPASYIAIGEINGAGRFQFDLRAWGQKFAYYYGEWEADLTSILRRLYDGGIFVDVGGSLGLFSVCLCEKIREKGASVLSFEPVLFNNERQKVNLQLNGLEDLVEIVPIALGDKDGQILIRVDASGADNNAFLVEEGGVSVPITSLDNFFDRRQLNACRVGLIKIDVEGFEPSVIKGAVDIIQRDRPIVLAEFNRERMLIYGLKISEAWEFMVSLGYRVYRSENALLVRLMCADDHENLFFIPPQVDIPADMIRSS